MNNPTTRTHKRRAALGLALLAGASLSFAQTADLTIATYDAGEQGAGINWGSMTKAWDGAEGNPAGSLLCTANIGSASDTPFAPFQCIGGGNPWWNNGTVDFALYQSVEFDIKWDPTSDITIAQFNDLSTWDTTMTNKNGSFIMQSWAGSGYLAGSRAGIDINLCGPDPAVQVGTLLTNMPIPAAAASGWTHVSVPIDPTKPGLAGKSGITMMKWVNQNWGIASNAQFRVWIDNIVLKGTAGPPPPPTVSMEKTTPGLQLISTAAGGSGSYNVRTTTPNYSWVDAASDVTYSLTIKKYPTYATYPYFETHILLIPASGMPWGPGDNSVIWNATNAIYLHIQDNPGGEGYARFMWRTNSQGWGDGSNQIWNRTNPPIPDLNSATILGKWSVTFNNNTNVTMTAPDNTTTTFVLPSEAVDYFRDAGGMYAYFGMSPNGGSKVGQASILERIEIKGGVASPIDDAFPSLTLDANWTIVSPDASGILVVTPDMPFWLSWTLPDSGFNPLWNPLATGGSWTDPGLGTPINIGTKKVLVPSSLSSSNAYFRLIKRVFTKLQVLMPGESPAPNTPSGKTGTPTAQVAGVPFDVTVRAVDADWNLITGVTDIVGFTSDDGTVFLPGNTALNNGTLTATMFFGTAGSWTVTATDVTDGTKTPNTSSATTVNP